MSTGTAPPAAPGRHCPLDYRYAPEHLARPPDLAAPALYVAGGLYGNLDALAAAAALAAAEPGARLVVGGDLHWFDAEPDWFAAVERAASVHAAIRGNVETELARGPDAAIGCGCAYPEGTDDATVARSNAIIARLADLPDAGARRRLAALPMHLVAEVGGRRVAIVHGDAWSLAGWAFAREALDAPEVGVDLAAAFAAAGVAVFASSHTCAPAMRRVPLADGGWGIVANNGAAGMPNARGRREGLLTRIGAAPAPAPALYGCRLDGLHVDALALPYDHDAFLAAFDRTWPAGSPAALSYRARLVDGPPDDGARAAPG